MRTNIEIDDTLIRDTMQRTGLRTKREVVHEALSTLCRVKREEELRAWRVREFDAMSGMGWSGDLDAMRRD